MSCCASLWVGRSAYTACLHHELQPVAGSEPWRGLDIGLANPRTVHDASPILLELLNARASQQSASPTCCHMMDMAHRKHVCHTQVYRCDLLDKCTCMSHVLISSGIATASKPVSLNEQQPPDCSWPCGTAAAHTASSCAAPPCMGNAFVRVAAAILQLAILSYRVLCALVRNSFPSQHLGLMQQCC